MKSANRVQLSQSQISLMSFLAKSHRYCKNRLLQVSLRQNLKHRNFRFSFWSKLRFNRSFSSCRLCRKGKRCNSSSQRLGVTWTIWGSLESKYSMLKVTSSKFKTNTSPPSHQMWTSSRVTVLIHEQSRSLSTATILPTTTSTSGLPPSHQVMITPSPSSLARRPSSPWSGSGTTINQGSIHTEAPKLWLASWTTGLSSRARFVRRQETRTILNNAARFSCLPTTSKSSKR